MTYRVEFSRSAEREFDQLPQQVSARVSSRINSLAVNPRPPGVLKLAGRTTDLYRIRVGNYRVIYAIKDDVLLVLVVSIGHRKEIYRDLS
jgi:mRNA interferase RelE/StbE